MLYCRFTLRRLIAGVTVLCVVMALVGMFPKAALRLTINLMQYGPIIGVAVWAWVASRDRMRTSLIVGTAVLLSGMVVPAIQVNWGRAPTFWERFVFDFQTMTLPCTIVVAVAAGIERAMQNSPVLYPPKQKHRTSKKSVPPVDLPEG